MRPLASKFGRLGPLTIVGVCLRQHARTAAVPNQPATRIAALPVFKLQRRVSGLLTRVAEMSCNTPLATAIRGQLHR